MRLFEFLLLINLLIVAGLFLSTKRPYWTVWLSGTAVVLTAIHLIWEGYRWQMVPAYGLTAVLLLLALIPQRPSLSRVLKILLSILALLVLIIAFALPILLPVPTPLPPTGPYAVGTTTRFLVDENRPEIYATENGRPRELMVQIWYPATPDADADPAPYMDSVDVIGPAIADRFNLPAFMFNHLNLTQTNAYLDAPLVAENNTYPVIIFSHGLNGFRSQNTTMAQELASHGYVVAAIDHTYGNLVTLFPDGRIIFYDDCRLFTDCKSNPADGRRLVSQWAEDIQFLLDEMQQWESDAGDVFHNRFDLANVGVFGHSTGGGTAVEFCYRDTRCQAGLGLDAWVLPASEELVTEPLNQPFMFIGTPYWLGDDNATRGSIIYENVQNEAYKLSIADTGHYDFSDLPLFSPLTPQLGLSGTIDSETAVTILNAYTTAFFDRYLKGIERDLLGGTAVYPEVTFEKRTP